MGHSYDQDAQKAKSVDVRSGRPATGNKRSLSISTMLIISIEMTHDSLLGILMIYGQNVVRDHLAEAASPVLPPLEVTVTIALQTYSIKMLLHGPSYRWGALFKAALNAVL